VRYSLPTLNWVVPATEADAPPTLVCPLEEIVEAARKAGFDGVGVDEVTFRDYERRGGTRESLAETLRDCGLGGTDVGVLLVGAPDSLETAARLARLAREVGAEVCIAAVVDESMSAEVMVAQLAACCAVMTEYGVRLALEFFPYGPVAALDEASTLCAAVGWERCGLLIDSWHFFRSGAPWALLGSLDSAQIALVHADDALPLSGDDLAYESRFRRTALGAGCFPIGRFARTLRDISYTGVVSLEVLSVALRAEPVDVAADTLRRSVQEYWLPAIL
jgi:sugar phosphate isomerase/epimerase